MIFLYNGEWSVCPSAGYQPQQILPKQHEKKKILVMNEEKNKRNYKENYRIKINKSRFNNLKS